MTKYSFGKPRSSKEKLYKKSLSALPRRKASEDGYIYLDVNSVPFVLGGIIAPADNGNEYYRLDVNRKGDYSQINADLATNTAGGSIRFARDADAISVRVYLRGAYGNRPHFCNRGTFGIDAYVGTGTNRKYLGKMMQFFAEDSNMNSGVLELPGGVNEVQINLPLYAGITKLEVGFPKGARIGAPTKRTNGAIAFYGSSITQGGCVSRPANSYANIICRALDADCVNYGFSGSAMGELAVAEHIASRELSCFVMDYDYNSPSVETLQDTHEPFFKCIRERQPDLPVVFVTHPFYDDPTEDDLARIAVVRKTYENALASGDKNVYFVNSCDFFTKEMRDLYAVDFLHPNDLGQFSMAETIFPVVKKAISQGNF